MAITTTLSDRWAQAKTWLTNHQADIVNQIIAIFLPIDVGVASLDEKTLLATMGAISVGELASRVIRSDQRPRITAIPLNDQQWLVVDAPKRPPKDDALDVKVRGIVPSDGFAQQWANQQNAKFIPIEALPWQRQEIKDWSQWALNNAKEKNDIQTISVISQSPWERYETDAHEIVAIRQVSTADYRTVWECQREAIPLGAQIALPPLRHYRDMSHAWAVQRYDALTTEPWRVVDLTPQSMVHHWVAARELTKTDPPRWVFYQPDPPMTTWSAASDVFQALRQWSAPSAGPPELLTDVHHPAYPVIQHAWQTQHVTTPRPTLPSPTLPLPKNRPRL